MSALKQDLIRQLADLPGIEVRLWKDTGLLCVFYKGRDFAHFHGDDVLDIRLSPKLIRQENLSRSVSTRFHPDRSPNSRWICIELANKNDVEHIIRIVHQAYEDLM